MVMSNSIYQNQGKIIKFENETDLERLQKALQKAQATSLAKTAFLANIAHELRTPLNTIIGFSQILDRHTSVSDEQRDYLNLILASGDHLLDLIEDILNITNIESGNVQLNKSDFDFYNFIESVESIYRAEAIEKGLEFDVEISESMPRILIADRNKIRQILSNLLSNALKFTAKGKIQLKIKIQESSDSLNSKVLSVIVSDTGKGIKPEELHKIFQPYQQTSTGLASHKGSGLGLAITKEFAELMNGNIEVESRWQQGTSIICEFQVDIPSTVEEVNTLIEVTDELETQEHHAIQSPVNMDGLSPELQERLKHAVKNYSLEQTRSVILDFPNDITHLKQFILEKADEFDFAAILDLFPYSN